MFFHCILVLLVLSWKLYFFIKNWKVGRNHGFYKSLVDFKIFFNLVDNSSNGFIHTFFLKSYNSEFLPFRHLELEVMKISSFSWLKNCNKFGKFQCISKSHFYRETGIKYQFIAKKRFKGNHYKSLNGG